MRLPLTRAFALFAATLLVSGTAFGQTTYTWNNAGTDWAAPANWTPNGTPVAGDTALFNASGSAAGSAVNNPTIAAPQSALSLSTAQNQNFGGWTITGGGSLTLGGAGSTGFTTYGPQTTTINGPTLAGAGTSGTSLLALNVTSGSTLVLAGDTAVTANQGNVTVGGGTLRLDNSGSNTAFSTGRLTDTAGVVLGGGTLALVGNSAGTTETVGAYTMNAGSSTVSVTNNGGAGAVLAFTDTGNLRDSTAGTVNFVGSGTGTLGSAGNAPRITFSGAINANTVNGALTSSASGATSVTYGWARVNSTGWAGIGANGIVALAETARDSTNLPAVAANEVTTFSPSTTTTTLSANLGAAATSLLLKITPTAAGQTLAVGTNSINASAVMLAGTTDFTITGTGGLFGTVGSTRYVYVTDGNTVLNTSLSFAGSNQPFVKSGAGTMNMNGAANQLGFTSVQNVNIVEGTLRGTLTTLGGGTSAGGAFTTLNLYGGVLEISGGGTFSRAINVLGAVGGGGIRWDGGTAARGDGGFSAINGNASVNLVTALGGTTTADLVWNTGGFVANGYALKFGSTKSNAVLTFQNGIQLDNGSAYQQREINVTAGTGGDKTILSGVVSGGNAADLLKTGNGVLELVAINTYQGNTFINGGELRLGGSNTTLGSNGGTGNIVIGSGATLSGVGTILQGVTKQTTVAAGGTIRGGSANTGETTGTLTLGNLTVMGGSGTTGATLQTQLATDVTGAITGSSKLATGTGTVNLDSTAGKFNILLSNDAGLVQGTGYSIQLITSSGSNFLRNGSAWNATTNPFTAADFNLISGSGRFYDSVTLAVSGNNLVLQFTPVPEPMTVLAVGAAGLGLATWVRRRRQTATA